MHQSCRIFITAPWLGLVQHPFDSNRQKKKVVSAYNFIGSKQDYTFSTLFYRDISILTFKALQKLTPKYMSNKISMTKNCHTYNTRGASANHLQIPSSKTKFGQRTFSYRAAKIWNDLPSEFLAMESLLQFKSSVGNFI